MPKWNWLQLFITKWFNKFQKFDTFFFSLKIRIHYLYLDISHTHLHILYNPILFEIRMYSCFFNVHNWPRVSKHCIKTTRTSISLLLIIPSLQIWKLNSKVFCFEIFLVGLILNAVLKTIGHSLVLCCYFYAPCRWLCWFRFRVFIFIETKEVENRFGTVKYVFFF